MNICWLTFADWKHAKYGLTTYFSSSFKDVGWLTCDLTFLSLIVCRSFFFFPLSSAVMELIPLLSVFVPSSWEPLWLRRSRSSDKYFLTFLAPETVSAWIMRQKQHQDQSTKELCGKMTPFFKAPSTDSYEVSRCICESDYISVEIIKHKQILTSFHCQRQHLHGMDTIF